VRAYTVYNHMLLPTVIDSVEFDYHHLKKHVQVWDVSCERQIEVRGPDAEKLVQLMTPRNLGKAQIDQCFYIPLVDERGGMLNDPVAIKLADDRFWISIADSDVLLWAKGLAYGFRFEVAIDEPDVNILAVQGPDSDELMSRVFGEQARTIRFFRGNWLYFEGQSIYVARSGYSKQGGFEIYLEDRALAEPLWDALFEAGEDEGGLRSYGNDMTRENTPFECGLGKFCDVEESIGCVGRNALLREAADGPNRLVRGLVIEGEAVPGCRDAWMLTSDDGAPAGQITSAAWSPDLQTNVSIGMIERDFWGVGQSLWVETPDGARRATVHELPFTT